ncbi:disulfide bond formation protein B [Aestuariicoccus sp. MJ-SS9]|uniref:disulfide bond formation protein B n=1 Tax=Aestuariicoccus sp. MJ-SS9 TaxID=3079855 RepID=UPI00290E76F3|nr:disulfide bond formation protein B [Aestuariicoccus sp. MJ-SS9]MDU8911455.1 disulfide bond formation protein B [Aestuariicoccus sp. MJ-SS9]
MTRKLLILLAAGGSAALLLGALGFQYLGELPPCKLCYWQRYPHVAAVLIGIVALILPLAILPLLGAAAALTTAGIGGYHTGVERGWWEGPTTCTSGPIGGLSTDDLLDQIMSAPLVRCDEVPWEMFGLSMASWNMLASLALAVVWIAAARRA